MEWKKFEGFDKIKANKENKAVILIESGDGSSRYLEHLNYHKGVWKTLPFVDEKRILAYFEINNITRCICKNGEIDGISKDFIGEAFSYWGSEGSFENASVRLCSVRNGRFLWTSLNINEVAPPYIIGYQLLPDIYSFNE